MKALSLLTLATLITAFSGVAHAENISVANNNGGNTALITITHTDPQTGEEILNDKICLQEFMSGTLMNYEQGVEYKITAELKAPRSYCDGRTEDTFATRQSMPDHEMRLKIEGHSLIREF